MSNQIDKDKLIEWLAEEKVHSTAACSSYKEIEDRETFQYENGKRYLSIKLIEEINSGKFDSNG